MSIVDFNTVLRSPFQESIEQLKAGTMGIDAFKASVAARLDGLRNLNGLKQKETLAAIRESTDPDVVALADVIERIIRSPQSYDAYQKADASLARFAQDVTAIAGATKSDVALFSKEQVAAMRKGMCEPHSGTVEEALNAFTQLAGATKARVSNGFGDAFAANIEAATKMVQDEFDMAHEIEANHPDARSIISTLIQNAYSFLVDVRYAAERHFSGDENTARTVMSQYHERAVAEVFGVKIQLPSWAADPAGMHAMRESIAMGTATSIENLDRFAGAKAG